MACKGCKDKILLNTTGISTVDIIIAKRNICSICCECTPYKHYLICLITQESILGITKNVNKTCPNGKW